MSPALLLHFDDELALARKLADATGMALASVREHVFPDGEIKLQLPDSLPPRVVILRSLHQPNTKLIALLLATRTARQLGAQHLTLVAPYLAYMRQDIAFHPVGTGPFTFEEWKQTDFVKVKKFDGYWQKGYPKVDSITWKPVLENNTRAAMLQTGETDFAYPLPYEQAAALEGNPKLKVTTGPSIIVRYISFNMLQKPFDNLKVRQAINYAINKEALAKVAFGGYAAPAEGVVPQGVLYAHKMPAWPYDPAKARQLLKEAGYPNGFESVLWGAYTTTTSQKTIQFVQQQLAQVGIKLAVQALEPGQRTEWVQTAPDAKTAKVRMYYAGWSSSTGEADWALRPLLATEAWPPKLNNTAYYSNPVVDGAIAKALKSTNDKEKADLYREAQEQIMKDLPWAPLVTEKNLYATSKRLSGVFVMPDGNINADEISVTE